MLKLFDIPINIENNSEINLITFTESHFQFNLSALSRTWLSPFSLFMKCIILYMNYTILVCFQSQCIEYID